MQAAFQEIENIITFSEVYENEELKGRFRNRLGDGTTPYVDLKDIDSSCELIWDLGARENQFLLKRQDKIILPKAVANTSVGMPFHFCGGGRVMVNADGKYGVIYSKAHYKHLHF